MLSACAGTPDAASVGIDHSGRMRGYVESRRVSDFCPDREKRPEEARCVVTRGWDYARGVTIVRTYDPEGNLISTDEPPGADLSLTAQEIARIEALMRADPRTRDTVNKPGVMLWQGGFVMREPGDKYCDRGSRCIRVIAATDGGNTAILHSVVDLMSDAVVYPDYLPSEKKLSKSIEEH